MVKNYSWKNSRVHSWPFSIGLLRIVHRKSCLSHKCWSIRSHWMTRSKLRCLKRRVLQWLWEPLKKIFLQILPALLLRLNQRILLCWNFVAEAKKLFCTWQQWSALKTAQRKIWEWKGYICYHQYTNCMSRDESYIRKHTKAVVEFYSDVIMLGE